MGGASLVGGHPSSLHPFVLLLLRNTSKAKVGAGVGG